MEFTVYQRADTFTFQADGGLRSPAYTSERACLAAIETFVRQLRASEQAPEGLIQEKEGCCYILLHDDEG